MLIIVLYIVAVFMETAIGIWIFGNIFPKRSEIEKKHMFTGCILFTCLIFCAYSFPKVYFKIDNDSFYIQLLFVISCIALLIFIICWIKNNQLIVKHSETIKWILFAGIIVMLSWQYWDSYQSGFATLLGNLIPVLFLFVFYKCSLIQAYLWEFLYLTNLGLAKIVYIAYAGTFENKNFKDFIYSPRAHTYSEVLYLLVVYAFIIILLKYIPIDRVAQKILDTYKRVLFIFTFCEWSILLILVNFGEGRINKGNLTATLIIVVALMFGFLILFTKQIDKEIKAEKNLLDVRNEAVERQYVELKESYERYRCLIHDQKHMLCYLDECLSNAEVQNAVKFIHGYQNNISSLSKNPWTGISTLDFMLNMKKRRMDELMVSFRLESQIENVPMEDADFVVVLGNLFDNAIEAVEKCQIGDREIELSVKNTNEMFIIRMKNTSGALPKKRNNRFLTDKKEKYKHGWGIESVKHIVSKYDGELSFEYDTNFFEVSVIISE